METDTMTADEQIAAHPILAPLLPYLQHRQPACQTGCVCGLNAAVEELEGRLRADQLAAAAAKPEPKPAGETG